MNPAPGLRRRLAPLRRGQAGRLGAVALAVLVAGALLALGRGQGLPAQALAPDRPAGAIPLAVLGDSNSHSYQDRLSFAPGSPARGGTRRAHTLNWVEVLAQLRGQDLDPGPWLAWGAPGVVARARELVGLAGERAPRKEDYLYNFANSGAACRHLMTGRFRQAPRLAALMAREPARWREGVVVIRIGLNDWTPLLAQQARDPQAPELAPVIAFCRAQVAQAIALLRAQQPGLRILVVGISNEIDDPGRFGDYRSARETRHIQQALDRFNGALRELAASMPKTAFFDDDAWFRGLWGSRDADGLPAHGVVRLGDGQGPGLVVGNSTVGDTPDHALLADHHGGLVFNALWAQALVARLREAFDLPLAPIGDEELWRFLAPHVQVTAPGS